MKQQAKIDTLFDVLVKNKLKCGKSNVNPLSVNMIWSHNNQFILL